MLSRSLTAAAAALSLTTAAAAQIANAPCFEQNFGANLGAGDDTIAPNNALGFTFPGPAGPVTAIDISSNGFIWLGSDSNSRCCAGNANQFITDPASIAAMWEDLYPPGGGGVFFNTFPSTGGAPARAVITWSADPEYASSIGTVTMQVQLLSTGEIVIAHDATCVLDWHTALIGVTRGIGATANPITFSSIVGAPINTGTNPTAYQEFTGNYDLAGRSYEFIPNGQGGYLIFERAACRFAAFTRYGTGCPARRSMTFYEAFASGAFDLSNTNILCVPNGQGGYVGIPGPGTFFNGFANNIGAGDDTVTTVALPFSFSHPGGSTSSLDVCSNGRVWLVPNSSGASYSPTVFDFLNDPTCIAPLWADWYPPGAPAGGGVFADPDPSNNSFCITWSNVPMYPGVGLNTMQLALFSDGTFEFRYQSVVNNASTGGDAIVGYTTGNGATDPGGIDISAALPFDSGLSATPLTLDAAAGSLPRIGTTFTMNTGAIPSGTPLGFMLLSLFQTSTDLTPFGMPGCTGWVDFLTPGAHAVLAFPTPGVTAPFGVHIPNSQSLVGASVFAQSATLSGGFTPLGVIASNGGAIAVGR